MQHRLQIGRALARPRPPSLVWRWKDPPVRRTLEQPTPALERSAVAALDETIPEPTQDDVVLIGKVVDPEITEDISVISESGRDEVACSRSSNRHLHIPSCSSHLVAQVPVDDLRSRPGAAQISHTVMLASSVDRMMSSQRRWSAAESVFGVSIRI
jgi:hypothetical protein